MGAWTESAGYQQRSFFWYSSRRVLGCIDLISKAPLTNARWGYTCPAFCYVTRRMAPSAAPSDQSYKCTYGVVAYLCRSCGANGNSGVMPQAAKSAGPCEATTFLGERLQVPSS